MSEEKQIWDIVLYYRRYAIEKPLEPTFIDVQLNNINLDINEQLDIFSKVKRKYQEELSEYNKIDNEIISGVVFITEDSNFKNNVKEFEKNQFFIEWDKNSKILIRQIIDKNSKNNKYAL